MEYESKGKPFFEIFDDVEGSRTDFRVLQGQIRDLDESLSVGMGIFPAGLGSGLVDETGIVTCPKTDREIL